MNLITGEGSNTYIYIEKYSWQIDPYQTSHIGNSNLSHHPVSVIKIICDTHKVFFFDRLVGCYCLPLPHRKSRMGQTA